MSMPTKPATDMSDDQLDRAIRAVLADSPPPDTRQRVVDAVALRTSSAQLSGTGPTDDPRETILPVPNSREPATIPHPVSLSPLRGEDRGRVAERRSAREKQPSPDTISSADRRCAGANREFAWNTLRAGLRPLIAVSGAALVAAAAVTLWLSRPSESWAQVQEAVRARPWILARYTTPDGERHEDWNSHSRDVTAMRHGNFAIFSDHRLKIIYEYNPKERTLTRRQDPQRDREFAHGFDRVEQQIFRGAERLAFSVKGHELVEQKRQTVTKHGRTWVSYELAIRASDATDGGQQPTTRLTYLVDPQTRLPGFVAISVPDLDPPSVEMEVSYPETGPIDIYDLGVPRDTKLVDLLPGDGLLRVIAEIKSSVEHFEPYRAFNIMSSPESPWFVGTPFVIWRKGASYRSEFGLVDSEAQPARPPSADVDQRRWWKKHWTELFYHPIEVCDGKTFWNNQSVPEGWHAQPNKPHPIRWKRSDWPSPKWKESPSRTAWPAGSAPLFVAYPQSIVDTAAYQSEPVLDHAPSDGPTGTIKLILPMRSGVPAVPRAENRYWIDPHRSHMVVRHELVTFNARKTPPAEVIDLLEVVEDAAQSPSGIWYPTRMRHSSFADNDGESKIETITRHYLDFDVKFSDDLFKPIPRTGEALK